jgi:hypothetical protein
MNCTLEYMKKNGIPLTRENYLALAYLGDVPEKLGAEEEFEIPEEIRGSEEANAD